MSSITITFPQEVNNQKVTVEVNCSFKCFLNVVGFDDIEDPNLPGAIVSDIAEQNQSTGVDIQYVMVAYIFENSSGSTSHEISEEDSYFTMQTLNAIPENSIFYVFNLATGSKESKRPKGKITFGLGGV